VQRSTNSRRLLSMAVAERVSEAALLASAEAVYALLLVCGRRLRSWISVFLASC
jgi:hypothetical protein